MNEQKKFKTEIFPEKFGVRKSFGVGKYIRFAYSSERIFDDMKSINRLVNRTANEILGLTDEYDEKNLHFENKSALVSVVKADLIACAIDD